MEFAQLRDLDVNRLATSASSLSALSKQAQSHGGDVDALRSKLTSVWGSRDGAQANTTMAAHVGDLDEVRGKLSSMSRVAGDLASAMSTAQQDARRGESIAKTLPEAVYDATKGTVDYQWREDKWGPYSKATPKAKDDHAKNIGLAESANKLMSGALNAAHTADTAARQALMQVGLPLNEKGPNGKGPMDDLKDVAGYWEAVVLMASSPAFNFLVPKKMQSQTLGWLTKKNVESHGGTCKEIDGMMTCVNAPKYMYARGGTTFGDTFVTPYKTFDEFEQQSNPNHGGYHVTLAHEKYHRDQQWRKYGIKFAGMYLAAEAAAEATGTVNKYEADAEHKGGETGYFDK
ncbi:MAG TPA: hypothetical protein VE172_19025 [Stackebrandtia sp.]|jgi:hypothetical protein|uniref:hypothetical protein n=1 Tax=Stackebrandtia sp. TaxID=2023065 RepID=UPI002D400C61|nr:hypothetical protein [Stackebrandtia sp.]HZE40896.1 hypothetical protein [Stackebrandtia sp.]